MKKMLILLLAVLFVVAIVAISFATIALTKHNLTTGGAFTTKTTDASATLCGFCHVPHGGSTATTGLPLWARKNPAGPYQLYGGGATLAGTTVNNPGTFSLTCLSCHDGTIGIGTVTKNGVDTFFAMTGNVTLSGNDYLLKDPNALNSYNPVIGTDLRNDHPVGFAFPPGGYGAGGGVPGIGLTVTFSGTTGAYLKSAANHIYPVYQESGALAKDAFECSTCHDPHLEDTAGQTKFLRGPNNTICQDCHNLK